MSLPSAPRSVSIPDGPPLKVGPSSHIDRLRLVIRAKSSGAAARSMLSLLAVIVVALGCVSYIVKTQREEALTGGAGTANGALAPDAAHPGAASLFRPRSAPSAAAAAIAASGARQGAQTASPSDPDVAYALRVARESLLRHDLANARMLVNNVLAVRAGDADALQLRTDIEADERRGPSSAARRDAVAGDARTQRAGGSREAGAGGSRAGSAAGAAAGPNAAALTGRTRTDHATEPTPVGATGPGAASHAATSGRAARHASARHERAHGNEPQRNSRKPVGTCPQCAIQEAPAPLSIYRGGMH